MSQKASAILNEALGKPVIVRMKGGRVVRGMLRSFDIHMNLILDEAEELEPAQRPLGLIVVRGDNVIIISPS
ncbi:MAG: LSm family protein [Candidatus Korarchaeota archaeon]